MKNLTQKQHKYTLGLFRGLSQYEAYREAKYSIKSSRATVNAAACRLAKNVNVVALLEELRDEAKAATIADVVERQQVLTEIVRGRLTDYTNCGPDGDLINIGPDLPNTAALQEVVCRTEYDKDGAGVAVVTRIKLYDPIRAVDILNKMDKLYSDSLPVSNQVINILVMSEEARKLTERILLGVRTLPDDQE